MTRSPATTLLRALAIGTVLLVLLYAIKLPLHEGDDGGPLRVALVVNGTLGDKSFFDSAARGLARAQRELAVRTRVIEAGIDPSRWESTFADVAAGSEFDLVITGGFAMAALVQKLADRYPHQRFVLFDAGVDASRCRCANVHAMLFRQNEGAYLAGHLAARVAALEGGGAEALIGAIGAMQVPVIDDFMIGFEAGAHAADARLRVQRQYVNSFTDPATGKELAKAQLARGARVLFHAAAASGQGVIEAAAEARRPVIGVDSDQYALFRESHPARAAQILSSVLKNVDVAVLQALAKHQRGTLDFGRSESLGLAEGGIALARGSLRWGALPPALVAELDGIERAIVERRLVVPGRFAAAGPPAAAAQRPAP